MIKVRLKGGLGNQLFQLAAALRIAKVPDVQLLSRSLAMYARQFEPDVARLLNLQPLGVEVREEGSIQERLITFGRIGLVLPYFGVNDRNFHRCASRSRSLAVMDGYFQDSWRTDELVEVAGRLSAHLVIPSSFVPPAPTVTVLHLRGLDFQTDANLSILGLPWFREAFEACYDEDPVGQLLVVTDDLKLAEQWVPEIIANRQVDSVAFQSSNDPLDDFFVLRGASRRILGNSTFGQWAVLLDEKHGRTYASRWLAKGRPKNWCLPHERLL